MYPASLNLKLSRILVLPVCSFSFSWQFSRPRVLSSLVHGLLLSPSHCSQPLSLPRFLSVHFSYSSSLLPVLLSLSLSHTPIFVFLLSSLSLTPSLTLLVLFSPATLPLTRSPPLVFPISFLSEFSLACSLPFVASHPLTLLHRPSFMSYLPLLPSSNSPRLLPLSSLSVFLPNVPSKPMLSLTYPLLLLYFSLLVLALSSFSTPTCTLLLSFLISRLFHGHSSLSHSHSHSFSFTLGLLS